MDPEIIAWLQKATREAASPPASPPAINESRSTTTAITTASKPATKHRRVSDDASISSLDSNDPCLHLTTYRQQSDRIWLKRWGYKSFAAFMLDYEWDPAVDSDRHRARKYIREAKRGEQKVADYESAVEVERKKKERAEEEKLAMAEREKLAAAEQENLAAAEREKFVKRMGSKGVWKWGERKLEKK